jgi:BASS family bile acid:Na+ symporter
MTWYGIVKKYFGIIFLGGLLLGFFLPQVFLPLNEVVLPILGIIIFISFLTIDYGEFFETLKFFHLPAAVFVGAKCLVPAALYFAAAGIDTDVALALLLLTATPPGMITPALTGLIRGDTAFVLALVVVSAFIAPFYLPFFISLVGRAHIELDTLGMMITLAELIFIPFAASLPARRFGKKLIRRTEPMHGAVSILLLFFALVGIGARGSGYVIANPRYALLALAVAVPLCALLMVLGYFGFPFLSKARRMGLAVAIPYMNIGLSVGIALKFFSTRVLLICVIYQLPVILLPVILRRFFVSGSTPIQKE